MELSSISLDNDLLGHTEVGEVLEPKKSTVRPAPGGIVNNSPFSPRHCPALRRMQGKRSISRIIRDEPE